MHLVYTPMPTFELDYFSENHLRGDYNLMRFENGLNYFYNKISNFFVLQNFFYFYNKIVKILLKENCINI